MFFMWFTQPMGSDCDAALGSYDVPGGRCVCGVRAPEAAVGARGGPTKIFSFTFNIYNNTLLVVIIYIKSEGENLWRRVVHRIFEPPLHVSQ